MKQTLYTQPNAVIAAAFAEGRKAGLRDAAAHIDWTVENLRAARLSADCGPVHRTWSTDDSVRRELQRHAAELRSLAGEP